MSGLGSSSSASKQAINQYDVRLAHPELRRQTAPALAKHDGNNVTLHANSRRLFVGTDSRYY